MKIILSILLFIFGMMLLSTATILCNAVQFKYPEPANLSNYGFTSGNQYVRTSNRNPFNSPNKSNKDTLTLLEFKDRWLKFNNGEMFEIHSDSLNQYYWKLLKTN